MSASSRPTGTTRGSPGTSSTTVGRPCGSRAVVSDAGRLVEEDVAQPLPRDLLPVHLDAVARADDGVQLSRLAVHGDAAGLDQLVRAPARRDSGPGEERVQSHDEKIRACRTTSR